MRRFAGCPRRPLQNLGDVLSQPDFLLPASSDSNNEFWNSLLSPTAAAAGATSAPPAGMVPLDAALGQQQQPPQQ